MFTRNRIIYLILAAAIVTVVIVALVSRGTTTAPAEITYTDSITGQQSTDIIAEHVSLAPDETIDSPTATIDGIDIIYNYLTNEQALNAQSKINDFLFARSGLASVHAAVVRNSFSSSGDTMRVQIAVTHPQAYYTVVIRAISQQQTIPNVTFESVE